jgi:lipoate-protein ligase B
MATQASQAKRVCEARWLGLVQYDDGLLVQERAVELLRSSNAKEQLLLLEHPHVFTLGRGADSSNILADQQQLQTRSIEVHEAGRGGDVTSPANLSAIQ